MTAWLRKVRRRKPGIYLARTEQHARPGRYENGYVGRSTHVPTRKRQHTGALYYSPTIGRSLAASAAAGRPVMAAATDKPWADLAPRWLVLRLPWWLSWKWVLAPLELLAIKVLRPRYNVELNRGNRRRVPLHVQRAQRRQRDAVATRVRVARVGVRWTYTAYRVAGAALVVVGLAGWYFTGR